MDAVFKLSNEQWGIDPSQKVLDQHKISALLTAQQMLEQVQKEVVAKQQAAEKVYQQRYEEGYQAGLEEGKQEYAMKILDTVLTSVESLESLEQQLVDVVMLSVSKVIGQFDNQEIVVRIIKQALNTVRGEKRILVRISACVLDAVRIELAPFLLSPDGSMGYIELRADPSLQPTDCILETQMGVVEASLDTQLKLLKQALQSRVR